MVYAVRALCKKKPIFDHMCPALLATGSVILPTSMEAANALYHATLCHSF